jgi:hypothetical protein
MRRDFRLRLLDQPDDVAVSVSHGRGQLSAADILDLLLSLPASVEKGLEAGPDVVNVPKGNRPGQALGVAVRVESDLLVADPEADVIGPIRVRLGTQKLLEKGTWLDPGL